MNWMLNLASDLPKVGFIVVFICDGETRHHSKRATIQKKAKYQKQVIEGYLKRIELMLLAKKREQSTSVEEINLNTKQETLLSNKIKSMEKIQQSSNVNVGLEFYENIKSMIEEFQLDQKVITNENIFVLQAKFRADSVLAYRCIYGYCDIVFSSDSDLAALAGSRCLGIKSFKYNDKLKNNKLSDVSLYTPSTETLKFVSEAIHLSSNSTRKKISEYGIFDGIENVQIRGLLALGLGCDVYLPGIAQLGKHILKKFIDKEEELTFENLLEFYYELHVKKLKNKKNINTTVPVITIKRILLM